MAVLIVMCSVWLVGAVAADCTTGQTCESLAKATGAGNANSTHSVSMLQKTRQLISGSPAEGRQALQQAIACAKRQECGTQDVTPVTTDTIWGRIVDAASIETYMKVKDMGDPLEVFGSAMHALLDYLTETESTRSTISIHNRLTETLKCTATHSYQMNLWDNQFPEVGPWVGLDVHTWTSGNTRGWSDTNAEAYYSVWCPEWNRDVRFVIMIRHQKWIRFKWDDEDVYNPCYDMWIEGGYYTTEKDDRYSSSYKQWQTIAQSHAPILVVGSAEVPNKHTEVTLKLKPHVADSRGPVLYEHSNFHGIAHPITSPYMRNLQGFNDKASSLRVPPGMYVALCEHAGFGGQCHEFAGDAESIPMNDAATSVIWVV